MRTNVGFPIVMYGPVPGIPALGASFKFVDGRDKPGHDPLGFLVT
jgi:hypothetical protein